MTLEDLGYNEVLEAYRKEQNLESWGVGRVISEHKERYVVKTHENEFDAEIVGNLRFSALTRADFPAVGDWVAISPYDENKVLIHKVFPRKTLIARQAVGQQSEKQIIATNIDYAFIVQAADRDFNLNRLERYLTLCHTAHVDPVILISKTDLIQENEREELIAGVRERIRGIPVYAISNETGEGIKSLKESIVKGKTYCLLGSSGVGKSTLLNGLSGQQQMKTGAISISSNKGRHVTSHRALILLENGGILVDNPGMREVGIADAGEGLTMTFETISALAGKCRFKDCTHTTETGCVVLAALEGGELDEASYENYLKMEREKAHFESTLAEKRKKDKDFGKMVKQFKKNKNSNRY